MRVRLEAVRVSRHFSPIEQRDECAFAIPRSDTTAMLVLRDAFERAA